VLYLGYMLARAVCAVLPLSALYRLAALTGDIWYGLRPRLRSDLRFNLELVPGSDDYPGGIDRLARTVVRNFALVVTEFLFMPRVEAGKLGHLVDLGSFDRLRDLVAGGPAIFVTAHVGNWELGAVVAALLGIDLHVVVYEHPDTRVARIFRRRREARGLRVMSLRQAARGLPAALEHTSVGIVADRDYVHRGMEVSFLGIPITVPFAYANLAIDRGLPVIPAFCIRQPDGRYALEAGEPVRCGQAGEQGARGIVEACVRAFEKCVEKYPEQWYLFERLGGGPTRDG
jgi:KDO2-lipid IV(A) lauroyltransferase